MPVKSEREYRSFSAFECRAAEDEKQCRVEGYASTFEPYALCEYDGITYYERISPEAFEGADMSDVLFLYNHEGQVLARQRNGSLQLEVDAHGLKVSADLSGSQRGREMYDEIRAGLVDQMSFAFTVAEDAYDRDSHTRTILRFKKLYDVSAVSMPANPTTAISARDWCHGAMAAEQAERLEAEARKRDEQKARIRIMSMR